MKPHSRLPAEFQAPAATAQSPAHELKSYQPRNVTIMIPALNEELYIEQTVREVLGVCHKIVDDYEIYLIDDGSSDRTGELMDQLAAEDPKLRGGHNPEPRGVGWAFQHVLAKARFPKMTLVSGDRAFTVDTIERLYTAMNAADLIVSYRQNQLGNRSLQRVILSMFYRRLMGTVLFRYDLIDFHSMVVYPVEELRKLDLQSCGYTFQLEILVSLVGNGVSVVQLPAYLTIEENGSRSLRSKTFGDVANTVWRLRRYIPGRLGRILRTLGDKVKDNAQISHE